MERTGRLAARLTTALVASLALGAAVFLPSPAMAGQTAIQRLSRKAPPHLASDPVADPRHPAAMVVVHVPSHGVEINGIIYTPGGTGPHPTLVLLHGLPGNEKNLDLAQAARRAGWNAVTFNYRGSWGSPGKFRFGQNVEDADAVLAWLRDPARAQALGIDPRRIAVVGHSMGGWVAAQVAAHDHDLMGVGLISMADFGLLAAMPRPELIQLMADNRESLAGVTPESMADDVTRHREAFALRPLAPQLTGVPLLVLTANDGLARQSDGLVAAVRAAGGKEITTVHVATDHGWNDHRIALETLVLNWLATLKPLDAAASAPTSR